MPVPGPARRSPPWPTTSAPRRRPDAAWAADFLTGRKLTRAVASRGLRAAALRLADIPEWLFDASYDAVSDLAETIALVLPPAAGNDDRGLAEWVDAELALLARQSPPVVQARLAASWVRLDREGRLEFIKLAMGAFRVGVVRQLVVCGLADAYDVPVADVAQRLVGDWPPNAHFREIVRGEHAASAVLGRNEACGSRLQPCGVRCARKLNPAGACGILSSFVGA